MHYILRLTCNYYAKMYVWTTSLIVTKERPASEKGGARMAELEGLKYYLLFI